MTGIEVVKVMYLALKFGGFPIITLLYGYNFKQYEYFFDQHIDTVLMLTIGSGVAVAESLKQFIDTVTIDMAIQSMLIGTFLVVAKSIIGVCVTAVMTWIFKILSPYLSKKSEPLKRWIKKTFK